MSDDEGTSRKPQTKSKDDCSLRKSLKPRKHLQAKEMKEILTTRPHPELQEQRLLVAVMTNNTERLQNLLESGVSPNATDPQSRSALHMAASRGYADCVRALLRFGANANKRDVINNTPLHLAACLNNLEIITMLLNNGADMRSLDIYGRNPLQLAESKLHLLRKSWKDGAIEMINLKSQLQHIVDVMISMWKRKQEGDWGRNRDNVEDLEVMKLTICSKRPEEVDAQMVQILEELQCFSIK